MIKFSPFRIFTEKLTSQKEDSDSAYFMGLMEFGELILKSQVSGILSAVKDSDERHRYSLEYKAVRASGIGEWVEILDNVLIGQSATYLVDEVREVQKEFTKKVRGDDWQFSVVQNALLALNCLSENDNSSNGSISLRRWPHLFVEIRNKARGHNFPRRHKISDVCTFLEQSLEDIINYSILFNDLEWAFLSQNISGKYNVNYLGENRGSFDFLKSNRDSSYSNGVYIFWDTLRPVSLMSSSKGTPDFFFPNGGYTDKKYEKISYISNDIEHGDSSKYLDPPGRLPPSETEGSSHLDVIGQSFSNVPRRLQDYTRRRKLEIEIREVLDNSEQYPIVTLFGRGGIGKTSTAIELTHDIAESGRYDSIIWFSARDIDLQPSGPKQVNPQFLTNEDIANYYCQLVGGSNPSIEEKMRLICDDFRAPSNPTLFIFDNFETVSSPLDIYKWVDTYVRLPNKVLITTRHKEFKGDYPIRVEGMEREEFSELIDKASIKLGVDHLVDDRYREDLFIETSGHPYVAKILLGEVAKSKKVSRVQNVVASAEGILGALFERTYSRLNPAAQRCFLTICGWKSLVPVVALEAVLLYSSEERFEVREAVEDLKNHSFVEIEESDSDGMEYVGVPLIAAQFGLRKLRVSPIGTRIEADTRLLQNFGATQETDLKHGIGRNFGNMMRFFAREIERDVSCFDKFEPIMRYLANEYPECWLSIAEILEEMGGKTNLGEAKECVRRYLETASDSDAFRGWRRLVELAKVDDDVWDEIDARMHIARMRNSEMNDISLAANLISSVLASQRGTIRADEKKIIVEELADIMSKKVEPSTTATTLSRLSWLYLHLQDTELALHYAKQGLSKEPNNTHCLGLITRLEPGRA